MISRHQLAISRLLVFWTACLSLTLSATADVPQLLNHQGRIAVNGVNFQGDGQFKFALVNIDATQSYWSNDETSAAGSEPAEAVTLAVSRGLYAVLLGDTQLQNMAALTPGVFDNADVRLRVWFNDGSNGFQLMTPDQRLAAAAYALVAGRAATATSFDGPLAGDVTGTQGATELSAATVTGKALTGYVAGAGTLAATDTILSAINKLDGNDKLMAPLASPRFTGTVGGITATMVGLGNANNTSDADKPVSTAQQTALDLKAPLASPTFTGTVGGITAAMVGLANVSDTSDADKPVSTAQQTALNSQQSLLDEKAPLASPTFTGTVSGSFSGPLAGNASTATSATNFSGALAGEVTGPQGATAIAAATVTGKVLTGFVSGAGAVTATDSILGAINKLNGNVSLKAPLASPAFTGTVSGITAAMVGLANVSDTSDADKPVSALQQTALDLKANLASPSFSGTVVLPAGGSAAAPLRLTSGTNLTTALLGSVEFDGTNLYLTTNAASPTRKTVTLSDTGSSSQIALTSVVAAPSKPVLAWGYNHDDQTTLPPLANVAAVAAGDGHSLALLDAGTVVAWGLNTSGQTTVPGTLTGVTDIAAGASHNLVRKSDGTLVAWGDNSYGQTTIPNGITTATKVAAGEKHSLALLANGSIRAWGDNTFEQTTLPSALTGVTVTAIAAGYDHCLALTAGGTVVAWGRNDAGQTDVAPGLTGVLAIAAGAYHSLALKSDGTVVAWGYDSGGQVSLLPAGLSGVTKLAGGYAFSMALKADGTLVEWGDNSYTQTTVSADATQVTAIAAGAYHALALRADLIPAQVARLDQDSVFTGKLGIKRTPAANTLEVEGSASKTTAGSWLANSDGRIKTEVESISGALQTLARVRLVDFRYTDEYRAAHPSIEDVRYPNVIAQEFAGVFPNNVKSSGELMPDGSPILQVDTYPLTIYTAAAVQELHRQNQALQQQVIGQERRLRKLEALLAK